MAILALIKGISGLGLEAYTLIGNLMISDRISEPEDISVYILNPDQGEVVSGQIFIDIF
ncbi:MAG: hypothetical protein ACFFEY_08965 [Candidatus Thorarchaeota archaeon]